MLIIFYIIIDYYSNVQPKQFAKMLGKGESEVSKWLSGSHNLTIKSIVKMETVLNEKLLIIPDKEGAKSIAG